MMLFNKKNTALAVAIFLLTACSEDFDNPVDEQTFSAGGLDLSRYVAIGDSITAGYADGALYYDGQINSFPNILAQSFAKVGGGEFTQPLVDDNLGGLSLEGDQLPSFDPRLVLGLNQDTGSLAPKRLSGTPVTDVANIQIGPFNNLGVPGAKSFHLVSPGYGNILGVAIEQANPYFVRFASSPETSVLTDAANQMPSFFTLWIGNNDVLGYATSGGTGMDSRAVQVEIEGEIQDVTYGTGGDDITNPNLFAQAYEAMVATLTAGDAKGVLANIPAITSLPLFTAVPYNPMPLDQATVDLLNASYATYNQGLDTAVSLMKIAVEEAERRKIMFSVGLNAPVILDDNKAKMTDLTGLNENLISMRQATPEDFILLSTSTSLGQVRPEPVIEEMDDETGDGSEEKRPKIIGLSSPLEDEEVLTSDEAAEVEKARMAYNETIKSLADANPNLAFLDAAAILADVGDEDGLSFGTGTIRSTFGSGGAFSLDGVHPTAKGYAAIANEMIRLLNREFSANVPTVDPSAYPEVYYEGIDTTAP